MKRIHWFTLILLPYSLFSQPGLKIVSYDVRAAAQELSGGISGNVFVRLSSLKSNPITFLVPSAWTIHSLRDVNNESYDVERNPSERKRFDRIDLERPDMTVLGDTVLLNIEFSAIFDTSSMSPLFLNAREFLLPFSDSISWLPHFGSPETDQASLEFTLRASVALFSGQQLDTLRSDSVRTWKFMQPHPISLSSAFTLSGINEPERKISFNADSTAAVSWFSSPEKFHPRYAEAVVRQLNDAMEYFSTVTGKKRPGTLTYAIVGDAAFFPEIFRSEKLVIHRNSPVYSRFDSSALNRVFHNHWLQETALLFCPPTLDSSAMFEDGFAAYLCMRYLASSFPVLEQQERISAIAGTLTFFPSGTLAEGHRSPNNTDEIVSFKGRYIFLMLEYLLGKESFDSVIVRMTKQFSSEPASFHTFQSLCEEEYGSSLGWFFDQWLHRSTAPEFVMQWKQERTPRGFVVVTATVEQRGDLFSMPVPLVFSFGTRKITKRITVNQSKQDFLFTFPSPPVAVELDPGYSVLRWLREIRISAHARTSLQYLSVNRDITGAEHEALYTLQLDPNNTTGSAPLVYFVLGNSAAAAGNPEKGKENFLKAMSAGASPETEKYKLLSLVQYANLLESEGKREEAADLYRRAIAEGMNNPLLYERAVIKAEMHLREPFIPTQDAWFELH